jgi:hypothetical protein
MTWPIAIASAAFPDELSAGRAIRIRSAQSEKSASHDLLKAARMVPSLNASFSALA